MHTLSPLDDAAVLRRRRTPRRIVTVEEHSVYGGLGSPSPPLLMQAGVFVPLQASSASRTNTPSPAARPRLFDHYGISDRPTGLWPETGAEDAAAINEHQ